MTILTRLFLSLALVFLALTPARAAQVESLDGRLASEPSCVSWGPNRIDCFYRAEDSALHHRWWDGARWQWEWLGSTLIASAPDCVTRAVNRIDCVAISAGDRKLHHRGWDGTRWSSGVLFEYLKMLESSGFGCTAVGERVLCLYHNEWTIGEYWFDGTSWQAGHGLRAKPRGNPECVSISTGRVDCFVAARDDSSLLHTTWTGGRFSDLQNRGGVMTSGISCVGWETAIDCFVRGTDNALHHRWWNGSEWSNWEWLGGIILGRPECLSWAKDRIDCFAVGTDNAMHHRWWDGSAWRGWERLGGSIAGGISCTTWGPGRYDCFARGTDNSLVHIWEDRRGLIGNVDTEGPVRTTSPTPVEDPMRQWRVLNTETVTTNEEYALVNLRRLALYRESQLGYVFRDGYTPPPLNLFVDDVDFESYGWTGTSGGHFVFQLPMPDNVRDHRKKKGTGHPHDPRKLDVNDTLSLAIYNTKAKKYLTGLKWSKTPAYEWHVRRRSGADFAIFNSNARAYLVLDESNRERLAFKPQ